ncbi:MAG: 2Fe-2S iron-sulfur cluster-binding protein, partial [Micromonosporaceae bacterium]
LTFRAHVDGEAHHRCYSMSSSPAVDGELQVTVKRVPGGVVSNWMIDSLAAGDVVEASVPAGVFCLAPGDGEIVAFSAGSGITPVLSLIAAALQTEPRSNFTLLYGNRNARSVMFTEELADLKDRYPERLNLAYVLSREPQEAELFSGRLDPARLSRIFDTVLPPGEVDEWFLCGPQGMVEGAQRVLAERAVPSERVHVELFFAEGEDADRRTAAAAAPEKPDPADSAQVTIVLDGRASSFAMGRHERVLDAARRVRGEVPFACTGGVCGTCRAKLVEGEVRMARNYALEPDELAAGSILTCQSSPVTDSVTVDYDA